MSQNKIYVGNLSYDTTSNALEDHFSQYGEIVDAKLIIDRETRRSKGFAFITYSSDKSAEDAVSGANGAELDGRNIRVNLAKDDQRRRSGGGGSRY